MTEAISSLLIIIGISVLVSIVTFWGMGGVVHWWFYGHRRDQAAQWKLQPKRFLTPNLVRHSFKLGGFNIVMGGVVGGCHKLHVRATKHLQRRRRVSCKIQVRCMWRSRDN
ncbi:MAG: hypothetical protein KC431_30270, partial [Myxococcales bacterium]|nr:hypothetical protein [Myxococcales bacterium]